MMRVIICHSMKEGAAVVVTGNEVRGRHGISTCCSSHSWSLQKPHLDQLSILTPNAIALPGMKRYLAKQR